MSWMTQTEAAAALGCSNRTIRRRIRGGMIKTRREGRNILVDVDTDQAVATVTQVGRQLAEVGAAAAIQKRQDADTLTAIQSTFTDALATVSACRESIEHEAARTRRAAWIGWLTALALLVALSGGGWLYHTSEVQHLNELYGLQDTMAGKQAEADTAMMTAEVRHIGEMAQVKARHEGETEVLRESLSHERRRAAEIEEQYAIQGRSLSERAAALERAAADLDRRTAQVDRLAADLRNARRAANLTGTVSSMWTVARETLRGLPQTDQLKALEDRMMATEDRHRQELAATQTRYETQLGVLEVRDGEQIAALRGSLTEEQKTVRKLEERLALMTEKLIAAVMEREQVTTERDRLAEQVNDLQEDLHQARLAADLSRTLRDWWASVRTALRSAEDTPEMQADLLSANR